MSGDPAPRRSRTRAMYVSATLAVGLAMLASAAAGLAGLDGRLAAAAETERASDRAREVSRRLERVCPERAGQERAGEGSKRDARRAAKPSLSARHPAGARS